MLDGAVEVIQPVVHELSDTATATAEGESFVPVFPASANSPNPSSSDKVPVCEKCSIDTCHEMKELDPNWKMCMPCLTRIPSFKKYLSTATPREMKYLMFPWWSRFVFHSSVRLQGRESLLIDVGAVGNLCGSAWAKRVELEGNKASHGTKWHSLESKIELEGVGAQSSQATSAVVVPIRLESGDIGEYQAIVVEGELPALLGLDSLRKHHAIICTETNRMMLPGPGGYKIALSPGSRILKLHPAPTGHLMLPCCEWKKNENNSTSSSKNIVL